MALASIVARMGDQMVEWNDRHDWGNGWGWVVMVSMMLLVVAVTVLLVRHYNRRASESVGARDRGAADTN